MTPEAHLEANSVRKTKLTCRLGTFIFTENGMLSLSLMKRIRDDVMGQYYNPAPGSKRLRSVGDVYTFVKNEMEINVPFKFLTYH